VMQQKPEVSTQAITAILIARNLERAADHATNIAEDVIFWLRGSTCGTSSRWPRRSEAAPIGDAIRVAV